MRMMKRFRIDMCEMRIHSGVSQNDIKFTTLVPSNGVTTTGEVYKDGFWKRIFTYSLVFVFIFK